MFVCKEPDLHPLETMAKMPTQLYTSAGAGLQPLTPINILKIML